MSGIVGQNAGRDSGVVGAVDSTVSDNAIDETKLKDALIGDFTEVTVQASDSFLLGDGDGTTKRDTVQGILDLATVSGLTNSSNTTWMTVSADEEVLTPLQPGFEAYMTSTQSNVTGDGTTFTATGAIWTETRDIGSNFSNGTFTAPIAGWYGFSLLWYISGATTSHTSWANYLVLNTGAIAWNHSNHGPNLIGGNSHIQVRSYIAYLSASDTAHLAFVISGSSKVVDIIGGVNSRFSGRLLG